MYINIKIPREFHLEDFKYKLHLSCSRVILFIRSLLVKYECCADSKIGFRFIYILNSLGSEILIIKK